MTNQFLGLPPARLKWSSTGEPQDEITGDVYYSVDDGLSESQTVFLQGCDLPTRWQGRTNPVIGELGFGTGLNFLACMKLWEETKKPRQTLHYLAVEGSPLTLDELIRAHLRFPDLAKEATALQKHWPQRVKGFHRVSFASLQLELTLLLGPVEEMLSQLDARIDSWFLDGFAPSKNQKMWSTAVFVQMARLSAPSAKIGTYTVAGSVRRGLAQAGFDVSKQPGFGQKRHRLEAVFRTGHPRPKPVDKPASVMIIGGGIAGACLAHRLARNQIDCTLIEGKELAAGASGNPIGLISPRLDLEDSSLARFYRTAFEYACRFYAKHCPDSFHQIGLIRRAETEEQRQKFDDLLAANALPDTMMEPAGTTGHLILKTAGTLVPKQAISVLTAQCTIRQAQVESLRYESGNWVAYGKKNQKIAQAKTVVLATGATHIRGLGLPDLRILRGQVSWTKSQTSAPLMPIIGKSYALKMDTETLLFGATHDRVNGIGDQVVQEMDHQRNLDGLAQLEPDLAAQIDPKAICGRTSYRASSPDNQPLAGPVADATNIAAWSKQHWGKLHDYTNAPVLPDLYMLNGLGSRGLTLAPLLAENLCCRITGQPSPLEKEAAIAVHPARFAARAARKS